MDMNSLALEHLRKILAACRAQEQGPSVFPERTFYSHSRPIEPIVVSPAIVVDVSSLLLLEGEAFLTECYAQILQKPIDAEGKAHYLYELYKGITKREIVESLATEPEAVVSGVHVKFSE